MARRPSLRPCSEPGCPELVRGGKCEVHRLLDRKRSDRRRPGPRDRGYDTRWERTQAAYLAAHPYCEDEEGCIEPATDVHHLDGLGPLGPRGHDWDNLQSLCHPHHSKRTARDQPGGWHQPGRRLE